MPKKKTLQEVKDDFLRVWGERYNYDLITEENYKNMGTKVPITCKKHGVFYTTPNKHIVRQHGCPLCKGERISQIKSKQPRLNIRTPKFDGCVNDYNGCIFEGKSSIQSYRTWLQMLTRCYDVKYHQKCPTYMGCEVCDEWKTFSNFMKWFDENYIEGYSLDKDILIKGNKIYSPETCCFVPNEINALLIKHDGKRGKYPIGITKRGNKFCARVNLYSHAKWIGTFDNIEDAFIAYKKEKERYLQEIADKYFNDGLISKQVRDALCAYQVEITD